QPVACCWLVTEVLSVGGLSRVPRDGTAREVLASSPGWWRPRVSVRPTADQPSRPGPLQRARIRRAAPRGGWPAGRGRGFPRLSPWEALPRLACRSEEHTSELQS